MTGQCSDAITRRRKRYTLVGIDGGPLFEPSVHGIRPVMWHTACYRGFVCDYALRKTGLFLERLEVAVDPPLIAPLKVNDVAPRFVKRSGHDKYRGLDLRVPFTGRLLLGRNFDPAGYQHMGFQHWSAYRDVLEATITAAPPGSFVAVRLALRRSRRATTPESS